MPYSLHPVLGEREIFFSLELSLQKLRSNFDCDADINWMGLKMYVNIFKHRELRKCGNCNAWNEIIEMC